MTKAEFDAKYREISARALARIEAVASLAELAVLRTELLGRSHGIVKELLGYIPTLAAEDRREAGMVSNFLKEGVEAGLNIRQGELEEVGRTESDSLLDPTMPARRSWRGSLHPVSLVIDEIADIFRELGFSIALGPEVESEWYNFTSLNFPADHPAMDLHDTLYIEGGGVLRTHTSPVQMRTLQSHAPPIRILAPGNVYRRDFFDATHSPMFAQIEGLAVDEGVSFADLKATLSHFARRFYGGSRRTRFRPSFFPFTEPSAEMDVETDLNDGRGLRWVEIMGCGLVHPAVLESAGVDSERYSGWAFGMGPARIAQSRYGISDCRVLFDSDVRFLQQFAP